LAASAAELRPEGKAGHGPLPRRPGISPGGDRAIRWAGLVFALLPAAALLFVLATLAVEAIPAIRLNGWGFFTHSMWNQGGGYNAVIVRTGGVAHLAGSQFGVLPEIVGTLLTLFVVPAVYSLVGRRQILAVPAAVPTNTAVSFS